MLRVLSFGFCPFIIIAGDSVLIIALNTVLQKYGGAQGDMLIACATIVQSYMQIVTLPLGGITSGTQPILSFNYGAKNIDRIKKGKADRQDCIFILSYYVYHFPDNIGRVRYAVYPGPSLHRSVGLGNQGIYLWRYSACVPICFCGRTYRLGNC